MKDQARLHPVTCQAPVQAEGLGSWRTSFRDWRLIVVLGFGLLYAVVLPPFEAPDEPMHFAKAYGIAEGQWLLREHPRALVEFIEQELSLRHDHPYLQDLRRALAENRARIPNVAFNVSQYSPLPYLLHAAAIKLAKTLSRSSGCDRNTLITCRLFSLLCFATLLAAAFRLQPQTSWVFWWVAVTPMALSQAAVVSIDYLVLGSSVLLLSASLAGGGAAPRFGGVLFLSIVLLVVTKPPYLPLVIVPLAAALRRQGHERAKALLVVGGATVLALTIGMLWYLAIQSTGIYSEFLTNLQRYASPAVDPPAQVKLLLMQPLHLGKAVAGLLVDQGPRLFRQAVGVLGWLDIPLPAWITGLWALLCLSSLPGECPLMMSHGKERLVMALACIGGGILSFLAVAIAIYVTWTPVGADELHLQGRYLHPCLLGVLAGAALLVPVVRGKWWPVLRRGALLTGALVIHTASLLVLLDRFKS